MDLREREESGFLFLFPGTQGARVSAREIGTQGAGTGLASDTWYLCREKCGWEAKMS